MRWGGSAVVAVLAHGAVVSLALGWHSAASPPGEPQAAVMIDLAPVTAAPEAPSQDIAPGPQMTEVRPETQEPAQEAPAEIPPPPDETKPREEQPPVEAPLQLPPPRAQADAVLDAAVPRSPPPKPRPVEPRKPVKPVKPKVARTTAPPASDAHADRAAAAAFGMSSDASPSPASWRSALIAQINRHKRFPSGASSGGTVTVAFTIDRSGVVTSARLVASSGDAALDAEAVALPRRASPLPPPPANIGGASISLAVPIHFSR